MEKIPDRIRRGRRMSMRLGCFGRFRAGDRVCHGRCAIRIRCAIERDRKVCLEVFAGLAESDHRFLRFQ